MFYLYFWAIEIFLHNFMKRNLKINPEKTSATFEQLWKEIGIEADLLSSPCPRWEGNDVLEHDRPWDGIPTQPVAQGTSQGLLRWTPYSDGLDGRSRRDGNTRWWSPPSEPRRSCDQSPSPGIPGCIWGHQEQRRRVYTTREDPGSELMNTGGGFSGGYRWLVVGGY